MLKTFDDGRTQHSHNELDIARPIDRCETLYELALRILTQEPLDEYERRTR